MVHLTGAAATNVGRIRRNNEDNYYLCGAYRRQADINIQTDVAEADGKKSLFAVCDGMGGEQFGELASMIAVETLEDFKDGFDDVLNDYIETANEKICGEITRRGGTRMGTTMAILSVCSSTARAYNIGDSRIYFMRGGKLVQISEDHTQVQRLIKQGLLDPDKAGQHPERHKLTQHLGIFPEEMIIEPYKASPVDIIPDDMFLLCSDGLTDMLTEEEICAIMLTEGDLSAKAGALIDFALEKGGRDNVTVVLVSASAADDGEPEVQPEPEQEPKPEKKSRKFSAAMKKIKDWLNEDAFML